MTSSPLKPKSQRQPTPMATATTFELKLAFAPGVDIDAGELSESIVDAIFAYDFGNRLLPGEPPSREGEHIIETSIGLKKFKRFVRPEPFKAGRSAPSLGGTKGGQTLSAIVGASLQVDGLVEHLRDLQADVWTVHNNLLLAETNDECCRLAGC